MNPQGVRDAIASGLAARGAWSDVDVFAYPAGDRAERTSVFELGKIADGSIQLDTLGGAVLSDYLIEAQLVLPGTGALESDFATSETQAVTLIGDIELWLIAVKHGKAAGVDSLDVLELARFELTPLADGGTAAELTFAVSEVA